MAYLYFDLQDTGAFPATVASEKHFFSLEETYLYAYLYTIYILTHVYSSKVHKQHQLAKSH